MLFILPLATRLTRVKWDNWCLLSLCTLNTFKENNSALNKGIKAQHLAIIIYLFFLQEQFIFNFNVIFEFYVPKYQMAATQIFGCTKYYASVCLKTFPVVRRACDTCQHVSSLHSSLWCLCHCYVNHVVFGRCWTYLVHLDWWPARSELFH